MKRAEGRRIRGGTRKRQGAAALSWREDVCELWSVPDAEQRLHSRLAMSRSSSMTAQLAAQRVHVLGEVLARSLAG